MFIDSLFDIVLGRPYEKKEYKHHLKRINSGEIQKKDLLEEFLNCGEFIGMPVLDVPDKDLYKTGIVNTNDVYKKTYLYSDNEEHKFSSIIMTDENNTCLKYSNSYIVKGDKEVHSPRYNSKYTIYNRLYKNHIRIKILKSYLNDETINIKDDVINLISPFYCSNSGHDLCYILNVIDTIYKTDANLFNKNVIIMKNMYNFTKNIVKLFFTNIIEIDEKQLYLFDSVTLFKPCIFIISKFKHITDAITKSIINSINDNNTIVNIINNNTIVKLENKCDTYDTICLYKCSKNVFIRNDIILEKFQSNFENLGYKIIIPENYNTYELIYILNNAKKIIVQTGGICYTNFLFFNTNANIDYVYVNKHNYIKEIQTHIDAKNINLISYDKVTDDFNETFSLKS